jgi:aconitate hydratase
MAVLPLQLHEGRSWESLGLDGAGIYEIRGLVDGLQVEDELTVVAEMDEGETVQFQVTAQVRTPAAVDSVEHGGIRHCVLRRLLTEN